MLRFISLRSQRLRLVCLSNGNIVLPFFFLIFCFSISTPTPTDTSPSSTPLEDEDIVAKPEPIIIHLVRVKLVNVKNIRN